jgi:hypothetical protein
MINRQVERHPLTVFLSITGIGLVVGLGVLFMLWLLLRLLGLDTGLWPMIEALSTAVTAAAVLGGAFVASRQLSELANVRHIEVADRLFNELNWPENIAARRWVFQNLPDDPEQGVASLSPDGRDAIKRVLNSLDRVAFLTQSDWIPDEMIMPWMNPMIVKSWAKIGPYVEYERQRRNEPDYYLAAQQLAERCLRWREKHLPEAAVTWVDDAL